VATSTAIYAVSGQLAAGATPIAVTGFNRDVVVENTAVGPPYTSYATELNPGEGFAFYQNGLPGSTNVCHATTHFRAAWMARDSNFSVHGQQCIGPQQRDWSEQRHVDAHVADDLQQLFDLANSASGGGTPNVTLNFADGTSFVTTYNASDWFGNSGYASTGSSGSI